jgi:alpha-1,2-mannosyltransferase
MERRVAVGLPVVLALVPAVVVAIHLVAPAAPAAPCVFGVAGALFVGLGIAARFDSPLTRVAERLPASFDGALRRRPVVATLWGLLALVALLQITRLSAFMIDPAERWGSANPAVEEITGHACLAAYVEAADLTRRGEPNVYAEEHYPAFGDINRKPPSSIEHISPWLLDAYEYPPPFLVLPRLGLALSNDFLTLRAAWFALRAAALIGFFLVAALAQGEERRATAVLLIPAIVTSLSLLIDLQFGQAHLTIVALAVAGMLALRRGHDLAGGALLGLAIVTKLFPAILLVELLVRRRFRQAAITVGCVVAVAVLALPIVGVAPYRAFFAYQLPRIASGAAFSFFLRSDLLIAANFSVFGLPFKLARLGWTGDPLPAAQVLVGVYTLALLAVAVIAARRARPLRDDVAVSLALLVLASLRSPLLPGAYGVAPALWLLSLLAAAAPRRALSAVAVVIAWIVSQGLPPLSDPRATIVSWTVSQIVLTAIAVWAALRGREHESRMNPADASNVRGPAATKGA